MRRLAKALMATIIDNLALLFLALLAVILAWVRTP